MLMLIFTFRTVINIILPSVVPLSRCALSGSIWQSGAGELSKTSLHEELATRGHGRRRCAPVRVHDLHGTQRLHPRQHGLRRQGVARHAARALPADWTRLRHGAPRVGHGRRVALLAERRDVACLRSVAYQTWW